PLPRPLALSQSWVASELPVTPFAGDESRRARQRLARADDRETPSRLVAQGLVAVERPLLVRRHAVGAHAQLGKGREAAGEREGFVDRVPGVGETVGQGTRERLVA